MNDRDEDFWRHWRMGQAMLDVLANQPLKLILKDVCTRGSMNDTLAEAVTTALVEVPHDAIEKWLALIVGALEDGGPGDPDGLPDPRAGERAILLAAVLALKSDGRRIDAARDDE